MHLRRADLQTKLHGKDCLQMAGDYNTELMVRGLARFLKEHAPRLDLSPGLRWLNSIQSTKDKAAGLLGVLAVNMDGEPFIDGIFRSEPMDTSGYIATLRLPAD